MIREPAVAGRFYTADPEELRDEINSYLKPETENGPVPRAGCVVPHAGYMFSGRTCGKVLGGISIPETAVILSPNHTGMGTPFSVWDGGSWDTPLGEVAIDESVRESVLEIDGAFADPTAHLYEHSIEVILPFLKVLSPQTCIVPVTVRNYSADTLVEFGKSLYKKLSECGRDMLIIASSDMTHQEPAEQAEQKDRLCIAEMEKVDPEGLFDLVKSRGITMCGVAPVTVLLSYCREKGITEGALIEYTNSGAAFGDYSSVVGYAGVVF